MTAEIDALAAQTKIQHQGEKGRKYAHENDNMRGLIGQADEDAHTAPDQDGENNAGISGRNRHRVISLPRGYGIPSIVGRSAAKVNERRLWR